MSKELFGTETNGEYTLCIYYWEFNVCSNLPPDISFAVGMLGRYQSNPG